MGSGGRVLVSLLALKNQVLRQDFSFLNGGLSYNWVKEKGLTTLSLKDKESVDSRLKFLVKELMETVDGSNVEFHL